MRGEGRVPHIKDLGAFEETLFSFVLVFLSIKKLVFEGRKWGRGTQWSEFWS